MVILNLVKLTEKINHHSQKNLVTRGPFTSRQKQSILSTPHSVLQVPVCLLAVTCLVL